MRAAVFFPLNLKPFCLVSEKIKLFKYFLLSQESATENNILGITTRLTKQNAVSRRFLYV
jgi:hypothetical protein